MKHPFLIPLIPILLALLLASCKKEEGPQIPPDPATPAELSAKLEGIIESTEVPGFAVTVAEGGAILFQEAFGYADLQARKPYTNQTLQHLASVSKTFVGAAVVKAVEQGYFTLETDINDILPVELYNPKRPDAVIRVKHLVTHTSGLLDNPAVYVAENYYIMPGESLATAGAQAMASMGIEQRPARPLEEFLAEFYLEDGALYSPDNFADTAPGAAWTYSNVATGLAAYLVETATGQPFAEYVGANILQPLGMYSSTYDIRAVDRSRAARCYLDKDAPFPFYGNDSYVEGGMFTSNEDLGEYLLDMMKGARESSGALFSSAGYGLLFAAQLADGIVPPDFADNHGIFWIRKGNTILHSGASLGVSTHLEFDASGKSGYALMTNMDASFDPAGYQEVARLVHQAVEEFLEAN